MSSLCFSPHLLPRHLSNQKIQKQKQLPWAPSTQLLFQYPLLTHLSSCKTLKDLNQILALTITTGIFRDNFVASRILSFAALSPNGSLPYALGIYNQIPSPDIFVVNILLRTHASSPHPIDAIIYYLHILESSHLLPDIHSFPLLLKACSEIPSLSFGRAIHAHVFKFGCASQVSVLNSLVHMYCTFGMIDSANCAFNSISKFDDASWSILLGGYVKCGYIELAHKTFDEMPVRDVVSWSVMINAYVQNKRFKEAMEIFVKMLVEKVEPNESVLVNILSTCAYLGALEQGKWVHKYATNHFGLTVRVGTALVDMYSKCGCVDKAIEVFNSMEEKNVLTWSAMIGGFAINGQGKDALGLFSHMVTHGIRPNEVTFIGILSACSHSGFVDEGLRYFHSMSSIYGLNPNIHHFCCMVDLYGRAGLLDEAAEVIRAMPVKPNSAVWGALLNACNIHGNFKLGEQVGKRLLELEPNHSGHYVLLSNIYAANGKWDSVARLRRSMRERGISKTPGCSFLNLEGTFHEFVAGDNSHPLSKEIYLKLDEMSEELKLAGYKPNVIQVFPEEDEEDKETALSHHI